MEADEEKEEGSEKMISASVPTLYCSTLAPDLHTQPSW